MSRELDALVAEKVMGWVHIDGFVVTMAVPSWDQGNNVYLEVAKWNPSTSISDAWLVIEEVTKAGHRNRYPVLWQDKGTDLWACEFGCVQGRWCDTAPEAICRAALETVKE